MVSFRGGLGPGGCGLVPLVSFRGGNGGLGLVPLVSFLGGKGGLGLGGWGLEPLVSFLGGKSGLFMLFSFFPTGYIYNNKNK